MNREIKVGPIYSKIVNDDIEIYCEDDKIAEFKNTELGYCFNYIDCKPFELCEKDWELFLYVSKVVYKALTFKNKENES